MRRFIVEVVLDAILLLFIVLLLGIISVGQPFPFGPTSVPIVALRGAGIIGFLSWAAVLVLVNRFARPVLVALTGRLLFSTMGFFVVIINAVAIWHHLRSSLRSRSPTSPSRRCSGSSSRRRSTPRCRRSWTPCSASIARTSAPTGAEASGASSSPCRRRDGTRSSRTSASSRSTTRSTRTSLDIALADTPIGPHPPLVRPRRARRQGRPRSTPPARSGSRRCSSSSARPT